MPGVRWDAPVHTSAFALWERVVKARARGRGGGGGGGAESLHTVSRKRHHDTMHD